MPRNMNPIKIIISKITRQSYWYKEKVFQDCEKFWNMKEFDLEVINLGSNSAKFCFNYDSADVKGANWAMGPQSLMIDLNILQSYYSYLKPGATVLIPLCPFSCLVGYDYSYLSDKYYTILNHSQFPCFNIHKRLEMLDVKNRPYMYIPLIEVVRELLLIVKRTFVQKRNETINEVQMENDVNRFINGWKSQFFIKDFDDELSLLNKNSYEESKEILYKIVDFCLRYGFKPVIVMPPVSPMLKRSFTSKMLNKCINQYVKEAVGDCVLFLNYLDDKTFSDIKYFRNSYFMNTIGSERFTQRVLCDLGLIKVDK